jgi:hypothetical protein
VKEVWAIVQSHKLAAQKTTTLPQRIPTVAELEKAFTTPWSRDLMSLVDHCRGQICAHDWGVCGLRSTEDMKRVKRSRKHHVDWSQGWAATEFLGGRAKLCGKKRNTRPWRVWTTCFCPGKRHIRPPNDFFKEIKKDGNPRVEVKWCTTCPLASLELIFQLQVPDAKRRYPKWTQGGKFGKANIADPAACALEWFVKMGVVTEPYCRNSGRKSLARWTNHLKVEYRHSVQIHGDQT